MAEAFPSGSGDEIGPDSYGFSCQSCPKRFSSQEELRSHRNEHKTSSQEHWYWCNLCNKTIKFKRDIRSHKQWHAGDKRHYCYKCDQVYSKEADLKKHERDHDDILKCSLCTKEFIQQRALEKHELTCGQEQTLYPCEVPNCKKVFKRASNLNTHQQKFHPEKKIKEGYKSTVPVQLYNYTLHEDISDCSSPEKEDVYYAARQLNNKRAKLQGVELADLTLVTEQDAVLSVRLVDDSHVQQIRDFKSGQNNNSDAKVVKKSQEEEIHVNNNSVQRKPFVSCPKCDKKFKNNMLGHGALQWHQDPPFDSNKVLGNCVHGKLSK